MSSEVPVTDERSSSGPQAAGDASIEVLALGTPLSIEDKSISPPASAAAHADHAVSNDIERRIAGTTDMAEHEPAGASVKDNADDLRATEQLEGHTSPALDPPARRSSRRSTQLPHDPPPRRSSLSTRRSQQQRSENDHTDEKRSTQMPATDEAPVTGGREGADTSALLNLPPPLPFDLHVSNLWVGVPNRGPSS